MTPNDPLDAHAWLIQTYRDDHAHGPPVGPVSSAEIAVRIGNGMTDGSPTEEVMVYHHLYPNEVFLRFSNVVPEREIREQANHLEEQASRQANHSVAGWNHT